MSVIDTNDDVSLDLAALKTRGVTAIGRYYCTKLGKRLKPVEAVAISNAGIDIFVVFEDKGSPTLTRAQGNADATLALTQAKAVGQPEGTAIYFALEGLPGGYTHTDLPAINDYLHGVHDALGGKYKVGVYSDGVVCKAALDGGQADFAWLSASLAFEGSRDFLASNRWSLFQKTPLDQDWDGLSVDENDTRGDFGSFRVGTSLTRPVATVAAPAPVPPETFPTKAMNEAVAQWNFFGNQQETLAGAKTHVGHLEGEDGYYQRVGEYWVVGTNTHGIDGRNHDYPWSAAFISYVMRAAGAGTRFRYSTQHSVYISQGIRDNKQQRQEAGYWTQRLTEAKAKVGDLVCWSRQDGIDYDHQNGGDYKGHTDLIVAVEPSQVWVIGGNVGDSVTKRPLPLNTDGTLAPVTVGAEKLFAVMVCRID